MFILSVTLIFKMRPENKNKTATKKRSAVSSISPFVVHFSVDSQLDTSVQFCNPDIENIVVNNITGSLESICY